MKKIENFLFWPVFILLFFSISKYGGTSTDIHVADTYYIIPSSVIASIFAGWLLVIIFLLKRIRHRHQVVNKKITLVYIALTVLCLGVFLSLGLIGGGSAAGNFTTSDLDALMFRNQLKQVSAWCCLVVQVIFLVYFLFLLIKRPVNHDKPAAGITNHKQ